MTTDNANDDQENTKTRTKRKTQGKRVITPARREQNRLAQQAWRRNKQLKKDQATTSTSTLLDTSSHSTSSVTNDEFTSTSNSSSSSSSLYPFMNTTQNWSIDILNPTLLCNPQFSSSSTNTIEPIPNTTIQNTHTPCLNGLPLQTQMATYNPSPAKVITPMNDLVLLALLDNALCLNMDLSDILACSQSIISPFYRPDIMLEDDPSTLTLAVSINTSQSRIIPPSLRPTLSQIVVPHHPGLDLLPLPALRDRSLLLSEATSTKMKFSPWALMHDVLIEGGLVLVDGYDGDANLDSSGLQSWDEKRWVARPWFASKWRLAVG